MQDLTGKKTMTPEIQVALQKLGFAFVEVFPPKQQGGTIKAVSQHSLNT